MNCLSKIHFHLQWIVFLPLFLNLAMPVHAQHTNGELVSADSNRITNNSFSRWLQCVEPDGTTVDCKQVPVPLDWNKKNGKKISIFVQRRILKPSGVKPEKRVQLWLNAGGPGNTSSLFLTLIADLRRIANARGIEIEVLSMDHRGTGRSARLGCPSFESGTSAGGAKITDFEWTDCLKALKEKWGDDLTKFSSEMAANDLNHLIEIENDERPTFVYGVSYGTTLLNTLLHLHEPPINGVILDSIALSTSHIDYDRDFDKVGRAVLNKCLEDQVCKAKLGPSPVAFLESLTKKIRMGHCDEVGVDLDNLRLMLGAMIQDSSLRQLVPATIYRLDRCNSEDQAALGRLISILTTAREQKLKSPFFKMESKALLYNIDLSERWKAPPKSLRDIKAKQEKLLFSLGLTPEQAKRYPNWPKYDAKAFAPVAKTNLPVLMLQGGLDPNTPLSRSKSAREAYSGQNQYFIKFPDTPHGVVFNTQVESKIPCGVRVLVDFITNPQVRPSKACLDELPRIDFNPTKLGEAMFGTPSVW